MFSRPIAALLLEVAAVFLSSHVWSRPLPFTTSIVAGNLSLLYDLFGQPSIDLVNWTLSVELKILYCCRCHSAARSSMQCRGHRVGGVLHLLGEPDDWRCRRNAEHTELHVQQPLALPDLHVYR